MRSRKLRITQTRPVRRVVYFNPAMFVTQRLQERKRQQQQLEAFLGTLNTRLRSPHCRRDVHAIRFEVMERLSRDHALRLYDLHLEECQHAGTGRAYYQVSLMRDEDEWRRRRRYHGFVLLVAHAEVPHTAAALARLHRANAYAERFVRSIKNECLGKLVLLGENGSAAPGRRSSACGRAFP